MPSPDKPSIVRRMFGAYRSEDRETVEQLLTEDFTFTSPLDDALDKAAYFERCWPNGGRIRAHVLERIVEQDDAVFVLYKCLTNEGKEFRNVEFFTFEGGRIRSVNVYFGASYRNGVFVRD